MTLPCEYANSNFVEFVTVADDDAEKRVNNSLVQIWKLKFGFKVEILFRLWAQGLVKILKLKFWRDFEAEDWSVFYFWCLVEVMKFNIGLDSEAYEMRSRFLFKLVTWPKAFTLLLISRTQPSGPLCLRRCFLYSVRWAVDWVTWKVLQFQ